MKDNVIFVFTSILCKSPIANVFIFSFRYFQMIFSAKLIFLELSYKKEQKVAFESFVNKKTRNPNLRLTVE